ncbi:MAG: hypothetical protein ACE5OR_10535, partial [bacterium]
MYIRISNSPRLTASFRTTSRRFGTFGRFATIGILLVGLLFGFAEMVSAQDETIEQIAHFGGWHGCVAVQGDYAYLGTGPSLSVLDISGAQPEQVASLDLPAGPPDIFISGNHAYVADGESGLQIVDISDPLNPSIVASHATPEGNTSGVHVSGDYAYVAAGLEGLKVVDVSVPSSPTEVGSLAMDARDVFVLSDRAYALEFVSWAEGKLWVIDITEPTNPTAIGSCQVDWSNRVFVLGDYAYVANAWKGLQIVDLSDPANPTVRGSSTVDAYDVAAYGGSTYVYVAGMWDGLMVLDASDPENPTEVKVLPDVIAGAIHLIYPRAYVACSGDVGFQVIDLSDPVNPSVTEQYEVPESVGNLYASADHLYLSSFERLWVYSLADPENLTPVGSYAQWSARSLFVQGNYLYALTSDSLYIIDVSDPGNLTQAGVYPEGGWGSLFVLSNYAYLLFNNKLQIIDVSTPSNPIEAGEFPVDRGADVFVQGDSTIAYVVDDQGLHIIDVSNPAAPQAFSSIETWAEPTCVWVWADTAFVGSVTGSWPDFEFSIEAFDVSDSSSPSRVAQTDSSSGEIGDIEVHDGTVFAAISTSSGVYTYSTGLTPGPQCPGDASQLTSYSPEPGTRYLYSGRETDGGNIQRHRKRPPGVCCLGTEVSPPEAAEEGCTATPEYTEGGCGSQVDVSATAAGAWAFKEWTGAASGTSPQTQASMLGEKPNCSVATAHFVKPTLTLGGGK